MKQESVRPDRTLIAILSIIGAIVVIALVVVFTRGGPADVDPATPEGVVQSYSRAMVDSDYTAARALLASRLLDDCDRAEPSTVQGLRMTVISSKADGDRAVVRVSMERGSGEFGGSGYTSEEVFIMVSESGQWKIETVPWDLTLCYNQGIAE